MSLVYDESWEEAYASCSNIQFRLSKIHQKKNEAPKSKLCVRQILLSAAILRNLLAGVFSKVNFDKWKNSVVFRFWESTSWYKKQGISYYFAKEFYLTRWIPVNDQELSLSLERYPSDVP